MGFDYEVNALNFTKTAIASGTFTPEAQAISKDQDPNDINTANLLHKVDPKEGSVVFTVGRHKTKEVATFWKSKINPNQSTFGKPPDELNFAFYGELKLDFANNGPTITFKDIGLAQGSNENGNNWWFGGANCERITIPGVKDTVQWQGKDSKGTNYRVLFQRGDGTDINEVKIVQVAAMPA